VIAGDPAQAADGAAIDLAEPAGLPDAAPLGDVLQDRFDLLRRQSRVEQGRPLPLREASLARLTAEHASGLLGTIATGHREISGSSFAGLCLAMTRSLCYRFDGGNDRLKS
jgi:hypothetical protein